jgi:hypothetical protein
MKFKTIEEFTRAGGVASAKKRLAGKTKEEISEYMKAVRAKRNPMEDKHLGNGVAQPSKIFEENRYPAGIE